MRRTRRSRAALTNKPHHLIRHVRHLFVRHLRVHGDGQNLVAHLIGHGHGAGAVGVAGKSISIQSPCFFAVRIPLKV